MAMDMDSTMNRTAAISATEVDDSTWGIARLFPAFFVISQVAYLVMMMNTFALFAYYPLTGNFTWMNARLTGQGPAMLWYGFLGYAIISGLIGTAIVAALPRQIAALFYTKLAWLLVLLPVLQVAVVFYLEHKLYDWS